MIPIRRISCGCIVIPTDQCGTIEKHTRCILLQACDNTDFNHTSFGFNWRDIDDRELPGTALTDVELNGLVKAIGQLIHMGECARDINYAIISIDRTSKELVTSV